MGMDNIDLFPADKTAKPDKVTWRDRIYDMSLHISFSHFRGFIITPSEEVTVEVDLVSLPFLLFDKMKKILLSSSEIRRCDQMKYLHEEKKGGVKNAPLKRDQDSVQVPVLES